MSRQPGDAPSARAHPLPPAEAQPQALPTGAPSKEGRRRSRWPELWRDVEIRSRRGDPPGDAAGLHYDSRRVQPGQAFVAIAGEAADGHRFIPEALRRGAVLVVSERPPAPELEVAWLQVANARRALAQLSANWFGRPGERLQLIGITGTNGKTTTAWLAAAALRACGIPTGLLGTIEYQIGGQRLASPHTTPESYDLQELLAEMAAADCRAAVLEVSSHALVMERVWGCRFAAAVFTNLTQDHLDFHGTLAAYREAKRRLFTGAGAGPPLAAVVNVEDPSAAAMVAGYGGPCIGYGCEDGPELPAQLRATAVEASPAGQRIMVRAPDGWTGVIASPLLARVNVLNTLAAFGAGLALGLPPEALVRGLEAAPPVPGRFQRVAAGQPFAVVVDYAHTPDALANVLRLARELAAARQVIVVFGCGGDRDRGKRPRMGAIAAELADLAVVTSDNPRSEAPEAILAEVVAGLAPAAAARGRRWIEEPDRRAAIEKALRAAANGDVVVVAGKGHERVQIVKDEKRHFDDAEEVSLAWRRISGAAPLAAAREGGACN
ncbi:MAG: UDP-N-acetylmuramoyl-L-alanyl-D-glutamate--2,6-diaminopimelate ligase [Terriglobales bacterium]